MKYRIPAGTRLKIAPDDDLTPYRPHRTVREVVAELRLELDKGWLVLAVPEKDVVVQVRREWVEEME